MKQNNAIEDIIKTITGILPGDVSNIQNDVEASIRSALQTGLSKMNLVTREEFDIQAAVLQRSREKLELLEKKLEQLEGKN